MATKITEYLIYITVFSLPVYLVRFSIFGIPTNALEILMLAVFASWLIFPEPSSWKILELSSRKRILLCLGLIFAGLVLSTLMNKNYAAGFGIIKSWFVLPWLFAWIALAAIPEGERKNIFLAYYLSALSVASISLAYYFFGAITFDGRLQGIFNSPNYLAMYLAPAIFIAVAEMQSAKIKMQKDNVKLKIIFFIASVILILIVFYLTLSYAAWLAVGASLAIVHFIKNKKIGLRAATIVVLILLSIFISQRNTEKFNNFEKYSRSSLESRMIIWRSASKLLGDNVVFGIGPGNFQNKYLEYQKYFPPYLEWAVPHPHNLYLAFWLYGGMLSIAGFIALILFWFREVIKKEKNSLWAISFAVMLYFLLHGLVDTTYFKNDLAVIFWLNFFMSLQIYFIQLPVGAIDEEKQALVGI